MMRYLYCLLLMYSLTAEAQQANCKISFSTMVSGKNVKLQSSQAYLFLNTRSGDITLKVELSSLDSELDTLDSYLGRLE